MLAAQFAGLLDERPRMARVQTLKVSLAVNRAQLDGRLSPSSARGHPIHTSPLALVDRLQDPDVAGHRGLPLGDGTTAAARPHAYSPF
jgi:hypothetical protein